MGFYVRPEDITPEQRALAAATCGAFATRSCGVEFLRSMPAHGGG